MTGWSVSLVHASHIGWPTIKLIDYSFGVFGFLPLTVCAA